MGRGRVRGGKGKGRGREDEVEERGGEGKEGKIFGPRAASGTAQR